MRNSLFLILSIISFIGFTGIFTNAAEPIIIDYADELVGESSTGTTTRKLMGNVQLRHGDVRATCENAVQYMLLNKFQMFRNVVIYQKTLKLQAPLVTYDGNTYIAKAENGVVINDKNTKLTAIKGDFSTKTQIANFADKVVLEDDSVFIYCDMITHSRITSDSKAFGNTLIKGKYTNTFLIADSVFNFSATNYSIAQGNPVLYQIDTTNNFNNSNNNLDSNTNEKTNNKLNNLDTSTSDSSNSNFKYKFDTLTVKSDIMEAFRGGGDEYYYFHGNVEISRNEISARCEKAYYYKLKQCFVLRENPVIWYDNMQLHADSITIFMAENKLNRVHALGNAISVTSSDTINLKRKDQLSGNEIDILFSNDSLKTIISNGEAQSVYFLQTDNSPDGAIKNSAEKITIEIINKQAENIILYNQVPGEYSPEPVVSGREKEFFLTKYKFHKNKPNKPIIILEKYLR